MAEKTKKDVASIVNASQSTKSPIKTLQIAFNNRTEVIIVLMASACRPKKEVIVVPPVKEQPKTDQSKADAINLLNAQQFKFNTLALKAKANLEINGEANDVNMNIRINNKQTIWVIITAVGGIVEVARAMITPDSIKIIDKINNKYIKKPFSYIYGFTNKEINFSTLQTILTGNAIDDFLNEKSDIKQEGGSWSVTGSKNELDYKLLLNTLFKVSEAYLNDSKNGQALSVKYEEYQKINNSLFPSRILINTFSGQKKIVINLAFTKIDGNVPIDFPFNVSKRFEVVN